ncbi:unnamed protein product [Adineta ricciae]|uniref:N-acetyltransferase domain-containing protein n=1 Tax=Adineta ricciae TaxID=249248 RepID=A0A814CR42_ADIRI|nr:unnamed protein product [Adineta ricciae]
MTNASEDCIRLVGDKVILRPWKSEDKRSLIENGNNYKIAINLRNQFPYPYTEQSADEWLNFVTSLTCTERLYLAIEVDEKAVGGIAISFGNDVHDCTAELGYWLGESYWNRGIMTEAVVLLRNDWTILDLTPTRRDLTCQHHDCSQHGTCLIGKCFCQVDYDGIDCERISYQPKRKSCIDNNDDTCFIHPIYGIGQVPAKRWKAALKTERSVWSTQSNDRWNDHLAGFDHYKTLPNDLGEMIEMGCGPFTQTLSILRLPKKKVNITKLTLWDPNANDYIKRVKYCSYKNGSLIGFSSIPTTIVSAPSEDMNIYLNAFDTILMINVLEHVQNAFQILQNLYNSLRPNGILIFGERWWDYMFNTEKYGGDVLHPIHIKYYVWKWFTDHFEPIYDARNHQSYSKYGHNGSYFIGRKRKVKFV